MAPLLGAEISNLDWTGDPGQSAGLALHGRALALPVKHCNTYGDTAVVDTLRLPLSNMGFKLP